MEDAAVEQLFVLGHGRRMFHGFEKHTMGTMTVLLMTAFREGHGLYRGDRKSVV